jgi:predicted transcriptional regulator of viral defense system
VKNVNNQISQNTDLSVPPNIVMEVNSSLKQTGYIVWMGDGLYTLRVLERSLSGSSNLDRK